MKIGFILIVLSLWIIDSYGQLTKRKDLDRIKNSKIIIIKSTNTINSRNLYDAAQEFWTLSEIIDSMPYEDAIQKVTFK